ncbi:MAG TPA: very short patch repair endonuclease [Acidobacteriaceae bacterium]|nr:very short patch repair endonuclease [Acidobacteriaceae bacterium]
MPVRNSKLPKILPRRLRHPLTRSQMMARVRSKDTQPEIRTRLLVYALGQSYRLHVASLPGKPDLANKAKRWAIFVHGCFWHAHASCGLASKPRTNTGYWSAKLLRNSERDATHQAALAALGFDVCVVWECTTRDSRELRRVLTRFFDRRQRSARTG